MDRLEEAKKDLAWIEETQAPIASRHIRNLISEVERLSKGIAMETLDTFVEVQGERDRYRKALEEIADFDRDEQGLAEEMNRIATTALKGGEDE